MAAGAVRAEPGLLGHDEELTDRLMFRMAGLWGFTRKSIPVPVSMTKSVDSGTALMMLDPEGDASANVGVADFEQNKIRMRYHVQLVFTGLHELVSSGEYDRSLLDPPRGISVTDARINPDYAGWEARSCVDFLPGSMWSGAGGG